MKRKKLIMKKRALSWILALALSGSSLALPVSAAEPDDNVQVETYDETSDFENDADIEITDEGQDADGGASEDINVTEDGNVEDFSDFSDEEATDADIDVFASEEDGQAVTLSGTGTEADPYLIETAADLPGTIEAGTVYALAADITLTSGQLISTIAGTLDGKGHVITLADKPLANSVSGTIQNLGVEGSGTLTLEDGQGSMANTVTQTGTVQNCYCTVNSQVAPMSYDTIGGMIGNLNGTIRNCYFAGSTDKYSGGVAAYNGGSYRISHVLWTSGMSTVGMGSNDNIADDSKKIVTADQIKASLGVLNTEIAATGFYWVLPEDGRNNGLPVLQEGAPAAGEVNWDDLDTAIASAENLVKGDYTEATWNAVAAALKEAGAKRCTPLNVSGPFHSAMLLPAGEKLAAELEQVEIHEIAVPYITNVTADYVTDPSQVKELLKKQISSSVRWQQSVERMIADGVEAFIEIGPKKSLCGFMKRIDKTVPAYHVDKVTDLESISDVR